MAELEVGFGYGSHVTGYAAAFVRTNKRFAPAKA